MAAERMTAFYTTEVGRLAFDNGSNGAAGAVPNAKLNDRERVGRRHSNCGITQKRED
jgi:hypothetical protein